MAITRTEIRLGAERVRRTVEHPIQESRREARAGSGWYAALARIGLVAKGISYALVGVLAVKLAVGSGGKATSRLGALQSLAQQSFGKSVLVLLAIGFAAYAIWRFVQAFAEGEDPRAGKAERAAKKWGTRIGYVGLGLIYTALAAVAVMILNGSGGNQSENRHARLATAEVLSWPAGKWLVAGIGLAIVGAGLWNFYRAVTKQFEDEWTRVRSAIARKWGARAGVIGHLARAVVFVMIGVFVTKAALDYRPKAAIGLDGALQKLAHASYGPYLLGLTAVGLIGYGLYCLVDARCRDVSASGGG